MDNRPIGFFDSGLGGLTCIPYILRALPDESIIYFGDTARTPYGSKAISSIRRFAAQIADFLIEKQDVKMLVVACNTISATTLDHLRQRYAGRPILGIISPAAYTVSKTCTPENRIGVIGTKATIASEAYTKKILDLAPGLNVFSQACPAIVPLIEEGIINNHIMDLTIEYYLDSFLKTNRIDTLVLGCTHYPLVRNNIERLYPQLRIIDPSEEILVSLSDTLDINSLHTGAGKPEHVFFASDLSENFVNMIDLIFSGADYPVSFKTFDLDCVSKERSD